jgi:hypothetical protein
VSLGAPAFFSYSRHDSDFVLKLAGDLKAAGASVWLDQLDITPGDRWDRAVQDALTNCTCMLVILSPASVDSTNVMDEVSFALDEGKTVIPVIYRDCTVPFRLHRVQHVDFKQDYARGLQVLLGTLAPGQGTGESSPAIPEVEGKSPSSVSETGERQPAAEDAQLEDERQKAAEQARLEETRKQAAEQARMEQERAAPHLVWGRFVTPKIRPAILWTGALILMAVIGLWLVHSRPWAPTAATSGPLSRWLLLGLPTRHLLRLLLGPVLGLPLKLSAGLR